MTAVKVEKIEVDGLEGLIYPLLTLLNNSLLISGGYRLSSDSTIFSKTLSQLDLSTFTLSSLALSSKLPISSRLYTTGCLISPSTLILLPSEDDNRSLQRGQSINLETLKISNINFTNFNIYSSISCSDSKIFSFGGSNEASFKNELIQIDSSLNSKVLTKDFLTPPVRHSASLVTIGSGLFVFGGCADGTYFNDLWKFSVLQGFWEKLAPSGAEPHARCDFGVTSEGYRMFVFSGIGEEYYSDLYEFNSFTGMWKLLDLDVSEKPEPRAGACIEYYEDSIYIFGGVKNGIVFNDFWIFNLKTGEYFELQPGPKAESTNFCSLDKEKSLLTIISTPDSGCYKSISIYDLVTKTWSSIPNKSVRGTNSGTIVKKSSIITLGGTTFNSHSKKTLTIFDTTSSKLTNLALSHSFYRSSISHFGNDLYIFGGTMLKGNFLYTSKLFSSSLLKLSLNQVLNTTLCSSGTYLKNGTCFKCESGKYSSGFNAKTCLDCPQGTFSKLSAANSQQQCIPCKSGTWSNQTGQSFCRDCPSNYYCPYGSAYPSEFEIIGEDTTEQPSGYSEKNYEYSYYSTLIISLIASLFSIGLVLVIFLTRVRQKLYLVDIYTNLHNHKQLVPMYIKKTNLGGCCSLAFFISAFSFIILTIVRYNILNIVEVRTLVPLVTVSEDFSASFEFEVNLFYYGGDCENNGECVEASQIIPKGLSGNLKSSCSKLNQVCKIKMQCESCSLGTSNSILLEFSEEFSFCSYISVNMTSTSSIPNQKSSAKIFTASDSSTYFKGINPSIFTFSLIPTLFKSATQSNSGFHISKDSPVIKGSQYDSGSFSFGSGVKVQIDLDVSNTCLHISRDDKTTQVELFSAIIGTVFGMMSSIGGLMNYFEKYYEHVSAWFYHKNILRYYYRRVRRIMAMIYQDHTFSNNYGSKSLPFSLKESRSESYFEEATMYRSRTNMSLK